MRLERRVNRVLDRLGMRLWSQNLNERGGGQHGSMWRHGRARLWLRQADRGDNPSLGAEWLLGHWHLSARVGLPAYGEEDDCTVGLEVPGVSLWLHTERVFPAWLRRRLPRDEHTTGFSIHDGGLWWDVWQNAVEWHSGTPRWRHGSFDPADAFLGRRVYSERDLRTTEVEVPMPEGAYPATIRLTEATWKRPRWPWPSRLRRAHVEMGDHPIPHPGKGENSWDCGEDATYSLTCAARTEEEAIGHLVASVLRSRRRYGGKDWRPKVASGEPAA